MRSDVISLPASPRSQLPIDPHCRSVYGQVIKIWMTRVRTLSRCQTVALSRCRKRLTSISVLHSLIRKTLERDVSRDESGGMCSYGVAGSGGCGVEGSYLTSAASAGS